MTSLTAPVKSRKPRTIKPAHGVARLSLAINGTHYGVRILAAQPGSGVDRLIRVRKADGTAYHVSHHGHGHECDCPDFIFSRDGIDPAGCKHVKALAAVGLL